MVVVKHKGNKWSSSFVKSSDFNIFKKLNRRGCHYSYPEGKNKIKGVCINGYEIILYN